MFKFSSIINQPASVVLSWHEKPGALERMIPARQRWRCLSFKPGEILWKIDGKITIHRYEVLHRGQDVCELIDYLDSPQPGWCAWRHSILVHDLTLRNRFPKESKRILLSGASGLIGRPLCAFLLSAGHEVKRLVRTSPKTAEKDVVYWDPSSGEVLKEGLEGFDVVIHLAGENIGSGLWTREKKQRLFVSRCRDSWLLSQVLLRLHHPPKTFLAASAIGFYGDRKGEILTEDSKAGSGFLADLCQKWEEATRAIEERGVRVAHLRFAPVLSIEGGVLGKMLPLFRLGLGGRIGSGEQFLSWISIDDLIGALYHILWHGELSGAINVSAPTPVAQAEFARMLAQRIKRPAFLPFPAALVRLFLGEMGQEMLLASTRAVPERLVQSGYPFFYPALPEALQHIIF